MTDHEPLARYLREMSAGDDAETGRSAAADRIASGAWRRAAELRAGSPARSGTLRRISWGAAAAAAVLAIAAVALHSPEVALAVEGDPVRIVERDRLRESSRVPLATWFLASRGASRIVAPGSGAVSPSPGSLLRITREPWTGGRFRVEIRRGDVEVSGSEFSLVVGGRMELCPASDEAIALASAGPALADDAGSVLHLLDTAPSGRSRASVRVRAGGFRASDLDGVERLFLSADESAAAFAVGPRESRTGVRFRITRLGDWDERVVPWVARGATICDAGESGDGSVLVAMCDGGDGTFGARVPSALVESALPWLRQYEIERAAGIRPAFAIAVRLDVDVNVRGTEPAVREIEHEHNGVVTTVRLGPGPRAVLESHGATEEFPSIASLRAARPDAAALFGEHLR